MFATLRQKWKSYTELKPTVNCCIQYTGTAVIQTPALIQILHKSVAVHVSKHKSTVSKLIAAFTELLYRVVHSKLFPNGKAGKHFTSQCIILPSYKYTIIQFCSLHKQQQFHVTHIVYSYFWKREEFLSGRYTC
jgi:hypothetical protein